MPGNPEAKGYEPTKRPRLLDVAQIDGRWAQVVAGGDTIKYLDSGEASDINWQEYRLTQQYDMSLKLAVRVHKIDISEAEIVNVHWGTEQEKHPGLKLEVKVFGIYEKK